MRCHLTSWLLVIRLKFGPIADLLVLAGTVTSSPAAKTIGAAQTFTITLTASAPNPTSPVAVALRSSNQNAATVPAFATIPASSPYQASVVVTAVNPGSATISFQTNSNDPLFAGLTVANVAVTVVTLGLPHCAPIWQMFFCSYFCEQPVFHRRSRRQRAGNQHHR